MSKKDYIGRRGENYKLYQNERNSIYNVRHKNKLINGLYLCKKLAPKSIGISSLLKK